MLTCAVATSSAVGAASPATSNGVAVAVPRVPRCPRATGSLNPTGETLGLTRAPRNLGGLENAVGHAVCAASKSDGCRWLSLVRRSRTSCHRRVASAFHEGRAPLGRLVHPCSLLLRAREVREQQS